MLKILLASLLGAIVCLTWGAVSWMVLQWHSSTLHRFSDEAAVREVIEQNTSPGQTNIYVLPAMTGTEHMPREDAKIAQQKAEAEMAKGPFVFAIVRCGLKESSMALNAGYAFASAFAACFLLALMLSWTMRLDYIQRVFFCALAGLFTGLVADIPMMIWFEAPIRHTLINLADHLCEWFLAGLAIAAFVPGRELWERMR